MQNRLTYKSKNDEHWYLKDGITVEGYDKLAAYENSGFEPNEMVDLLNNFYDAIRITGLIKSTGISTNRLAELAQADLEGRCIIKSCIDKATESKENSITLEDAIQHCYESISRMKSDGTCAECISEHEQLAKWLEELNEHHMVQIGKEICYLQKVSDGFELRTTTIISIRIGKNGTKAITSNFRGSIDVDDVISNTRILHNTPRMILVQEFFFDAYGLKEKAQRWVENRGWKQQEGL